MSRKTNLLLTGSIFLLAACGGPDRNDSSPAGLFTTKHVEVPYILHDSAPSADRIFSYASSNALNDGNGELPYLKEHLPVVADCFGLDRAVFTGLVRQESAFDRTQVSSGGAIGWTQFTTIGLLEVKDQLGGRGPTQARASATKYFRGVIQDCIVAQVGLGNWLDAWDVTQPGSTDLKELKNLPLNQLVYGAILLKTNLSDQRTKAGEAAEMKELYRMALEAYNGDALPIRQAYAKKILGYAAELAGE